MKIVSALLVLAAAIASPDPRYFRYDRPIQLSTPGPTRTCLIADAALFAHTAAPDLADIRLYHDRIETPYFIQSATIPENNGSQVIRALNLGKRDGQTVFDTRMPAAGYSDIEIKLSGRDFIAAVAVAGSRTESGRETKFGQFTIFDLTSQRLGHSTVLHLPESDFPFLHFSMRGHLRPEQVEGLVVDRGATATPSYVQVASSGRIEQKGKSTIAEFVVPAHVPVDRIEIVPGPTPANFSREVTVRTVRDQNDHGDPSPSIAGYGSVLRVHTTQDFQRVDLERLTLQMSPTTFDQPSRWTVTIDNGDDAPLVPPQINLQMLERDICFEAVSAGDYALYYDDPSLNAPRYDLGRLVSFHLNNSVRAVAGIEQVNPEYQARPDTRPFTERHPSLLWAALILVIAVLGGVAYRSAQGSLESKS